jgi:hypothetical protein
MVSDANNYAWSGKFGSAAEMWVGMWVGPRATHTRFSFSEDQIYQIVWYLIENVGHWSQVGQLEHLFTREKPCHRGEQTFTVLSRARSYAFRDSG